MEMEKRVEVARALVDDAIAKSVWFAYSAVVELAARMEKVAYGVEVPRPRFPV